MTGPLYLESIQEACASANSWQQIEGALFALRAVAARIRRHTSSAPNGCNGQADRAQQEQQLLLGLFETVCSPNSRVAAFLNNPYVCGTAASLVGAYAAWFDNTVNSPLEGALRLLLHALGYRDSWRAAAAAFRALTMRCAARLANVAVLQSLAAAAIAGIAPAPQPGQVCLHCISSWVLLWFNLSKGVTPEPVLPDLAVGRLWEAYSTAACSIATHRCGCTCVLFRLCLKLPSAVPTVSPLRLHSAQTPAHDLQIPSLVQLQLEDRQAVLEGLVRIATYLQPPEALDCALSLQQPFLARTQAILTNGSSTAAQGGPAAKQLLQHLAHELQLMAVLIKGMEMPGPPQALGSSMHPAMKLLEAAWPALTAVAEAPVCQQDADVVQALCEVYKVRGHMQLQQLAACAECC
jgi:hypothetical protein